MKEAAEFEAQDKKRKEGIDARNDADSMVFQTEKAMEEAGDKIDPSAKDQVQADIDDLKKVLEATANGEISDAQADELKAGKEKLMKDAQALFAKMYEQSQAAGGAGQEGPGPDMGGAADDVVDADYKEV